MAKKIEKSVQTPGERLKLVMKEQHCTQAQLAERVGRATNHISMIVRGERNLTIENAKRIAKVLNVRPEWLLGLDDFKTERDVSQAALTYVGAVHILIEYAVEMMGYSLKMDGQNGDPENPPCYYLTKDEKIILPISLDEYGHIGTEAIRYIAFLFEGLLRKSNNNS